MASYLSPRVCNMVVLILNDIMIPCFVLYLLTYSRLQKSCNKQAEQWKTTIELPHMNLIIFPASACPSSWFKHSKSIVVFHCSACLLQDFCNLLYAFSGFSSVGNTLLKHYSLIDVPILLNYCHHVLVCYNW